MIGCLIGLEDYGYIADNKTRMPLLLADRNYTNISYEDTFVTHDYITDFLSETDMRHLYIIFIFRGTGLSRPTGNNRATKPVEGGGGGGDGGGEG